MLKKKFIVGTFQVFEHRREQNIERELRIYVNDIKD